MLTCVAVTVLDWEDITTICNGVMTDEERMQVARTEGGTECNKSPLKVQARAAWRVRRLLYLAIAAPTPAALPRASAPDVGVY